MRASERERSPRCPAGAGARRIPSGLPPPHPRQRTAIEAVLVRAAEQRAPSNTVPRGQRSLTVSQATASPTTASRSAALTPAELEVALADLTDAENGAAPDAQGEALATRVRTLFDPQHLPAGPDAVIQELVVAWALESAGAESVRVVADDGTFSLPLRRLGQTDVFAGVATLPSGTACRWTYETTHSGRRTLLPEVSAEQQAEQRRRQRGVGKQLEVYATHPDSRPQPGVPSGTLTAYSDWRSAVYPGTTRDWWVYVPAQYRAEEPACAMVFQDGAGHKDFVPTVFDNLIAKGEMPVTVGVFVDPGVFADGTRNRSAEYDTLSDQYSRFLLEEILPEVERTARLRHDPQSRAISGLSSGGICAFTVAWERPDAFHKVLSWIGSFTNIARGASGRDGGHNYPALVRGTAPKPIRVFLQDGQNDLNHAAGDWWLANQEMASALTFAGYDHAVAWGRGFHSAKHGRAILPDSLRWLWRGWRP